MGVEVMVWVRWLCGEVAVCACCVGRQYESSWLMMTGEGGQLGKTALQA
jgi:hypothetical protein